MTGFGVGFARSPEGGRGPAGFLVPRQASALPVSPLGSATVRARIAAVKTGVGP